jgi:FkbM family methyltransferase
MSIEIIETHSILPDLVRRGGVVVDCGAHLGSFSMEMIRRFACRCYAFEASPLVFSRMAKHSNLISRNIAICDDERTAALALDNDITRNRIVDMQLRTESIVQVDCRHLGRLICELGITDIEVLKMDIEGAELEVIDSLDDNFFCNIGQITIEFHDFLGYAVIEEVVERIERLVGIGFWELYWSRRRNTGDVLLVNRRRVGPLRYMYEQGVVRRVRAASRMWQRGRLTKNRKIALSGL